ncbi:Adenosylcobinamide-GDP ribazoletransferase [bacterium HR19]|nr:Adenosylcobinamide-GDP ribazoletransferase [bacterium HR19]
MRRVLEGFSRFFLEEIRSLLLIFSFFSRINFRVKLDFQRDFKRAVKYIPVFSFVSGFSLYLLYTFLLLPGVSHPFPEIILFSVQYFLFNYFHFDGFLDASDAFFLSSSRSKEEILKVMDDPRVGSFALLSGVIYILTKINLYVALLPSNPLIFPFAFAQGRASILFSAFVFPRSAKNYGLGYTFISVGRRKLALPFLMFLIPELYFFPVYTVFSLFVSLVLSFYFVKKLGGFTGDIFGAICEISELSFLFLALFIR